MSDGPLQTHYKGYVFRSRLEARWAVFMDCLGVRYLYEPEGFELGDHKYLPDFYLPELRCWLEVKGYYPDRTAIEKAYLLAELRQEPVFILWGEIPWQKSEPGEGGVFKCSPMPLAEEEMQNYETERWKWYLSPENEPLIGKIPQNVRNLRELWLDHPTLIRAYNAARSARFEHGLSGCTLCHMAKAVCDSPSIPDLPEQA